jgi:hypothetical protein
MRKQSILTGALLSIALATPLSGIASAAVIDRVAVIVGKTVITETEVIEELRLTAFESSQTLNPSPAERRAAAERLVDQQLLRDEMQINGFAMPQASVADSLLQKFRQEHFHTLQEFQAALTKYGITEDELKQHLWWEFAVIQFTEARFQTGLPATPLQDADRATPSAPAASSVDQQMDAWLKDARASTHVVFKPEAFQ